MSIGVLHTRPEKPKRKIEKVFFEPGVLNGDNVLMQGATIALCNDGSLWRNYTGSVEKWFPFPPIPEDGEPTPPKVEDPKCPFCERVGSHKPPVHYICDTCKCWFTIEEIQKRIREEPEK